MWKMISCEMCLLLLFVCCNKSGDISKSDELVQLNDLYMTELLQEELWSERDMYDAGHVMMLPLHYAFKIDDEKIIKAFGDHFDRFFFFVNQIKINLIKMHI